MMPIVTESNWGSTESLDGLQLQIGEPLRIQWPNGSITETAIAISVRHETVSDHGHPAQVSYHEAYVVIDYHGAKVKVPVAGLLAERLSKPSYKKGDTVHFATWQQGNQYVGMTFMVSTLLWEKNDELHMKEPGWVYRLSRVATPQAKPTITYPPLLVVTTLGEYLEPGPAAAPV
jgi:hypothetical protein